jgi:hypothetical protein
MCTEKYYLCSNCMVIGEFITYFVILLQFIFLYILLQHYLQSQVTIIMYTTE